MDYIEKIKELLNGKKKSANSLVHGLKEIVEDVNENHICFRKFSLMNNAHFLLYDIFQPNWSTELKRFCSNFNIDFNMSDDGSQIIFFRNE